MKAFEFVKLRELPPKPRGLGIVEIRGPYYSAVTTSYLEGLLNEWGEYIDGYKFAGGSQRLLDVNVVKKTIKICHEYDVYVSTGGFIERVIVEGPEAVDKYLEECKSLGFDVVEVSSGLAEISIEDKVEIVKQVRRLGMKAKPEVSVMLGAGAGTHMVGYEEGMKLRDVSDVMTECASLLDAGAYMLMLESEGITEDLPPERWRLDVINRLIEKFGFERWMFEASDPAVFKWYLKNVGRDVNVFIDHSQVVEFTAWKLMLWGDRDIWAGKKLRYR